MYYCRILIKNKTRHHKAFALNTFKHKSNSAIVLLGQVHLVVLDWYFPEMGLRENTYKFAIGYGFNIFSFVIYKLIETKVYLSCYQCESRFVSDA